MTECVYFYCAPYESPEKARYQHTTLGLAEGLQQLGIRTFANVPYWQEAPAEARFAINCDELCSPADCDAVVFNNDWLESGHSIAELKVRPSQPAVYLNAADGWRTRSVGLAGRDRTLVLRSHYNRSFRYPSNVTPWAFGLTNRILEMTRESESPEVRSETLLVNYRLAHGLRVAASKQILPGLSGLWSVQQEKESFNPEASDARSMLFWKQTGRRHYPSFYRKLRTSRACFAFGGYFAPRFSSNVDSIALRFAYKVVQNMGIRTRCITQFDSWRFWESLAAGCLTLHVDLDAYACRFPVQPVNWVHYVGFDFKRLSQDTRRLKASRSQREDIAAAGREWALQHYSPRAVAERFLELLQEKAG